MPSTITESMSEPRRQITFDPGSMERKTWTYIQALEWFLDQATEYIQTQPADQLRGIQLCSGVFKCNDNATCFILTI